MKHFEVPSASPEDLPGTALSVYLPEGYDTSGALYPVLYLIHGTPGDEMLFVGGKPDYPDWTKDWVSASNVKTISDRLIREGRINPLLVVCPNMSAVSSLDANLIKDIVSFMDKTFRTLPRRESRAIAGHSTGGFRAMFMTFKRPELFSVVGGFSSYFEGDLRKAAADHKQKSLPLRFWMYAGTRDGYSIAKPNREFAEVLRENGLPVLAIEDDGDHFNRLGQRLGEFIEYSAGFLKW